MKKAGIILLFVVGLFMWEVTANAEVYVQGLHMSEEQYEDLMESVPDGHRLVTNEEFETLLASRSSSGLFHRSHVQRLGWSSTLHHNSHIAGSVGSGLRLEALQLQMLNIGSSISYRFHIQNRGWEAWKSNGQTAGTVGEGLRTEAIQIRTSGKYGVSYSAHVQGHGWLPWVSSGATSLFGNFAGTTGQSRRLEALMFVLYVQSV